MKQYLIYACADKYERKPLELAKQISVSDGKSTTNAESYVALYKEHFAIGEYSAIHILVLDLDAAAGKTEVVMNEYAENPLKKRIVINEAAKSQPKRKSALDAFVEAFPTQGQIVAGTPFQEEIHD